MTTDSKQVLTDKEIEKARFHALSTWEGIEESYVLFARAIEQAVLSKLRGAGEQPFGHVWRTSDTTARIELEGDPHISDGMAVYASPQVIADDGQHPDLGWTEVRNAALEEAAGICDRRAETMPSSKAALMCRAIGSNIRARKSAPAAEDSAKVAGDVELPELPDIAPSDDWDSVLDDVRKFGRSCYEAGRQQRGDEDDDSLTVAYLAGAQAEKERQRRSEDAVREALEESQSPLTAMLHETRHPGEISERIVANRAALSVQEIKQ